MRFEVENNYTKAHHVPLHVQQALDQTLRYPKDASLMVGGQALVDPDGWDGWIRLLYFNHSDNTVSFPTGLLGLAHRVVRACQQDYALDDRRNRDAPGKPFAKPIALRDYQAEAVGRAIKDGRGVIDCPPRAGKTRLMAEVVNRLGLPCLWVCPTDRIAKQTLATINSLMGKHRAVHLVGSAAQADALGFDVVVTTINSAAMLPTEWLQSRQVLVVDEWHHAAAQSYRKLFLACPHIFYRLGMTGTHFRSGPDGLAMQALLSNTIYKITSIDLRERGYLIPTDVTFLPVAMQPLKGLGNDWNRVGKHGIWDALPRNQLAARVAAYLAKKGRKVLMLTNRKDQGRMLRDLILSRLPKKHPRAEFESVEFCSTDLTRRKIDGIVSSFNSLNEIKVLIGTSMLGEGVDLPMADCLIYCRGEKAEVSLMQNAFRVCTAAEGKAPRALIVDFADRHHRTLFDHAKERLAAYDREPIFHVRIEESLKQFHAWLLESGHIQRDE